MPPSPSHTRTVDGQHKDAATADSQPQITPRYSALAYPSDFAGRFNSRVVDDGSIIAFVPSPFLSFRIWPIIVIVACGIFLFAAMILGSGPKHGSIEPHRAQVILFAALNVLVFLYYAWRHSRASKLPWIVVDRIAKHIDLPRQNRKLPFANIIRLQLIEFGTGRHRWPDASAGELQIVVREADREQTWCVVSDAYPSTIKRFMLSVRATTEISISSIGPTLAANFSSRAGR